MSRSKDDGGTWASAEDPEKSQPFVDEGTPTQASELLDRWKSTASSCAPLQRISTGGPEGNRPMLPAGMLQWEGADVTTWMASDTAKGAEYVTRKANVLTSFWFLC